MYGILYGVGEGMQSDAEFIERLAIALIDLRDVLDDLQQLLDEMRHADNVARYGESEWRDE